MKFRFSTWLLIVCAFISCKNNPKFATNNNIPEEKVLAKNSKAQVVHLASNPNSAIKNLKELGPKFQAGRINALNIDKKDNNHLLVGTDGGGIWRSIDQGNSWNAVSDYLPLMEIHDISQDASDQNIFYAIGNDSLRNEMGQIIPDILVSNDNGISFEILHTESNIIPQLSQKLECHPSIPGTFYVLNTIPTKVTGSSGIEFTIYLNRILRSSDFGLTFEEIIPPYPIVGSSPENTLNDFLVFPDGGIGVCTKNGYLYSSTGDPGTFIEYQHNLGTSRYLATSHESPNHLTMLIYKNGNYEIIKSSDNGATWSETSNLISSSIAFGAIGVHPKNPDIFLGGGLGLNLTKNGGQNYEQITQVGVDYHQVEFDTISNRVYLCYDQGIGYLDLNTLENQQDFTYLGSGLSNIMIHRGNYHEKEKYGVIIGLQDKGTQMNLDGNGRFKGLWGNDGSYCAFNNIDTLSCYVSYQRGTILKVKDFTPNLITFPNNINYALNELDADSNISPDEGAIFIHPFWVNNNFGNQLYYPTKKRLWISENGTDSWMPTPINYDSISPISTMKIAGVPNENPTIFWSANDILFGYKEALEYDEANVVSLKLSQSITSITASTNDDETVYITLTGTPGNFVFKISDLFETNPIIENLSSNFPSSQIPLSFAVDPENELNMIIGTFHGLYFSKDGGDSWFLDPVFPLVQINDIKVRSTDNQLFIFTYGRGAWSGEFDDFFITAEIPYNGIDDDCDPSTLDDDLDQDGFILIEDCNDNDPSINPNSSELCDNIDNNCNDQIDEGLTIETYYLDEDMDGFGDPLNSIDSCTQPNGTSLFNTDCDDSNPLINPNAVEIANNDIDENCDGLLLIIDEDNDGFNSDEDCNDNDPDINPSAAEICDNLDNDCNDLIDDGLTFTTYYIDEDNDGYGDTNQPISSCTQPNGTSSNDEDCNDTDPTINPAAIEIANNDIDEDCDGQILIVDEDNDGFNSDEDCNDNDPEINPSANEICDNLDNDCNDLIDDGLPIITYYLDGDNDGFGDDAQSIEACGPPTNYIFLGGDCDDSNAEINPDAIEIVNNGIDENCDGIDSISSVLDLEKFNLSITPNPANNFLKVSTNHLFNSIQILTIEGRLVQVYKGTNSFKHELDLRSIETGIYLVRLKINDQLIVRRLAIIN